jgi:hypothetical protein
MLKVAGSHMNHVAMRASVESDKYLVGHLPVQIDSKSKERSQWWHCTEFSSWKEKMQLALLGNTEAGISDGRP